MDFLFLAVLYVLLCGLLFSCYLLRDRAFTKRGPLGSLRTAVAQLVYAAGCHLVPTSVREAALYAVDCVFFRRNCYFQVIFLLLMLAGHVVVFVEAMPHLYRSQPDVNHVFVPMVLLTVNMVSFVSSSWSDPGVIRKSNHATYTNVYACDGVMYRMHNVCPTCRFTKPARSKHCAIYDACIFKFDHYCLWLNNAVGGLNHRYFLSFLVSLLAVCVDGVLLITRALRHFIQLYDMWNLLYVDSYNQPHPVTATVLAQSMFLEFPCLVILNAALTLTAVILAGFVGYHVWLVVTNQTTNELYKSHRPSVNPYNRGLLANVTEEVFPKRSDVTAKTRKRR